MGEHGGAEGAAGGVGPEERAKAVLDDLRERLPEGLDMEDIRTRVAEPSPYMMVALQVCGLCHGPRKCRF